MKTIVLIWFGVLVYGKIYACDICGCSVGGNYFGILPHQQKHFVGFRYRFSEFYSEHPLDNTFGHDYFHTTELWARYVWGKTQIYLNIPLQTNKRVEKNESILVSNWSDISLQANHLLFNYSTQKWKFLWQGGIGIRFPTGRTDIQWKNHNLQAYLQPGTGAFGFLANTIMTVKYQKTGLNVDFNYRITAENAQNYTLGNRLALSIRGFHSFTFSKITCVPSMGIDIENFETDTQNSQKVDFTGGSISLGSVGVDALLGRFSAGFHFQNPIFQNFNNGQTQNNRRLATQIIYLF